MLKEIIITVLTLLVFIYSSYKMGRAISGASQKDIDEVPQIILPLICGGAMAVMCVAGISGTVFIVVKQLMA